MQSTGLLESVLRSSVIAVEGAIAERRRGFMSWCLGSVFCQVTQLGLGAMCEGVNAKSGSLC
jgi:hypothetical protein